jgi:hypothetical protein
VKPTVLSLQKAVLKMTQVHFCYVALYMFSIIIFDSWNLFTHQVVVWRWEAATVLLVLNAAGWYLARTKFSNYQVYKLVAFALIAADAVFAGFNLYWQRGMASPSVVLFAVPIVLSAVLHSRRAIWSAATVCTAAYTYAAVSYFHVHYGEGIRVELYGHLVLFSGVFFILAFLLTIIIKPQAALKSR